MVYKPRRGETPLWDFPEGTLCQREVAAYVVSRLAGWDFVPPTVLRDGPAGVGAVQVFVDHEPGFTAFDATDSDASHLKRIALFDLIVNNADRKAGHVLRSRSGRLWAIDHGVCFAAEPKLRTVLWDFIDQPIPPEDSAAAMRLAEALSGDGRSQLTPLLSDEEISALEERVSRFSVPSVFPPPGPGRPYPWPPI